MSIGDIIYMVAIILFAWITFGIIRGNFQRKFDKDGNRIDLDNDNSANFDKGSSNEETKSQYSDSNDSNDNGGIGDSSQD